MPARRPTRRDGGLRADSRRTLLHRSAELLVHYVRRQSPERALAGRIRQRSPRQVNQAKRARRGIRDTTPRCSRCVPEGGHAPAVPFCAISAHLPLSNASIIAITAQRLGRLRRVESSSKEDSRCHQCQQVTATETGASCPRNSPTPCSRPSNSSRWLIGIPPCCRPKSYIATACSRS